MAEHDRTKSRGKKSISHHPLFPATVALWFGALFGLGTLAIRPSVLDGLAEALHLGGLGAAFAPPVDTAGRFAIVSAMAAIGVLLGLTFARRFASPKASAATPKPAAQSQPIDAGGPLWSELKQRRRELADYQETPQPMPIIEEPVLEREPQIFQLASIEFDDRDATRLADEPVAEDGFVDDEPFVPETADWLLPSEPTVAESEAELEREPEPEPEPEHEPDPTAAERIANADLHDLSHVELLERLALSMQQRSERASAQAALAEEHTCEAPQSAPEPPSELTQVHATLDPHVLDGDADRFEAVTAPEPAHAIATYGSPTAPVIPVEISNGSESAVSEENEDDMLAEGYSSLLDFARPTPRPFIRVQHPEIAESEAAVVFPGQAERRSVQRPSAEPTRRPFGAPADSETLPQDPAVTEKALRDALAALQRMSGAA